MALILNSAGKPEPSPEISRRLRAVHAGLHLRFMEYADGNWAVCMNWQPDDRRWEMVQRNELDPSSTYDIIGYLPLACSPDEAPAYLERSMRTYPRNDIKNMADKVIEYNETQPVNEALEQALEEVLENPLAAPKKRGRPRKNA